MTSTSHTLYRFFNAEGELLYVGRTINPRQRWRSHEKTKDWFAEVAYMTRKVYPTHEEVDQAERTAITGESPIHNIALNGRRDVPLIAPKRLPSIPLVAEDFKSHATRLEAAGYDLEQVSDCLGEVTICECPACHASRLCEFENLRSKYEWHPAIRAQIVEVERSYFAGHWLTDWYYDLFDIEMFARGHLVDASKTSPMPAYAEFEETTAKVDCPFCFGVHVHRFASGAATDRPIEAGCTTYEGGRYRLYDDFFVVGDALYAWGDRDARCAA